MKKVYLFYVCLFLYSAQSYGQINDQEQPDSSSTSLSEVLITENRLQIPFNEQNRNISLITQEQIIHMPVRSINELLSYVAGVDIRQRGPWGSQADVSIDGGTFEQTTLLINGIKISDPQTAHHNLNIPVPLGAIERIEILRGPAARIYGINSLTGAINIITKKELNTPLAIDINLGSGFKSAEEEDKGLYNARGVQIGTEFSAKNAKHLLFGSHESGNGYRYNTPFNNNKLFYQSNISNKKNGLWSFLGAYTFNDFGVNAYYAAPIDREAKEIVQTGIASMGYKTIFPNGWTINPRVSYRFNHDDYRFNQHDLTVGRNLHTSHVINTELNTSYKSNVGTIGLGVEVRNEFLNSTNLGNHNRNNYGFYAEYKPVIVKKLSLNIGSYLNYNDSFGWQLYPGLDLGYQLKPGIRLYVNTGSGQRIPSFTDLYTKGGGNVGNPDLQPEDAWYAEGGVKINTEKWFITTSYFYRKVDDFIDWTRYSISESWFPSNFSQNRVRGISFKANYRIVSTSKNHWFANLSYTFLDPSISNKAETEMLSKYAIESLKHQLIGSLVFNSGHFSTSIAQRFMERINYKNYFITDIKLAWGWQKYRLTLDANNLFDITYIESSAVPLPGRWFNLGLSYRY